MKRIHPAWLMLIACCFLQAGGQGTIINSIGIMIPSVLGDLQFSQGSFMLYLTLQGLFMAGALPVVGRLLPKYNIRAVVSIAAVVVALAYASMGQFHEVWQWYIAGPVLGIAACAFILTAPIIISNWFKKRTGLAMGLAMACSGIAGAIVNPLGGFFIEAFGWRIAYALLAGIALVLVLPFSLFVIRFKPSDMGVAAYGAEDVPQEGAVSGSTAGDGLTGVSAKTAVRSLAFVCLFLVASILSFVSSFMQLLPTYATTGGLAALAAYLVSAAMIGNIVGKLVLGWLNDKLGARNATIVGLGLGVVSLALLLMAMGGTAALALAGAATFGAMTAMVQVSVPLMVRTAFGQKDYSAIYSYVSIATTLVGSLGLTVMGMSFDAFGSYAPIVSVMIGTCVLAAVLVAVGLAAAARLPRDGDGGSGEARPLPREEALPELA
ncbi:MFS transporter [Arabiibacter massiliensis]|uniref:MFS transporter n=1 Tax=Arabiibacter massiliensis TaxID=1870985 RepID=UPI001E2A2302|nr:MFS transporter [Arabiibacter massiliensis]